MSFSYITIIATCTLLACLVVVAILLMHIHREHREPFRDDGNRTSDHLVVAGTSSIHEPCPLLPLRRFPSNDTERDVSQFQADVVEPALRSIETSEDNDVCADAATRMKTRPPCVDPFLRQSWQPSEEQATPKTRLSNGKLYDSVHNIRTSVDTGGSHPHVSLLHVERVQPYPSSIAALSAAVYANPFPQATTSSDGLLPTNTTQGTVTRALMSEAGFQMQTDMPHSLRALRERLALLESRLVGDVPYTRIRSCIARTCQPSQLYVFRDVYYRKGGSHGFQVEWTVKLHPRSDGDTNADTENDSAEAELVDGRVVGTYLPGADFYPGELTEDSPLAHATTGMHMYKRSLPYAEVRP